MFQYLQSNGSLLLVAGVILITMSMMMHLAKRRRTQQPIERLTAAERTERLKQQRGMRGDLEELMVEIEQMSKRLAAQLDAKTIHLERLIAEADRRIAQLNALAGASASPPDEMFPAARTEPTSAAPVDEPTSAAPPQEPEDRTTASVYHLADQGMDPVAIARELNEHVGKIELILALRKA